MKLFSFWSDNNELSICYEADDGTEFLSGKKGVNLVNVYPKFSEAEAPKTHREQIEATKELRWILMNYYGLQAENAKLKEMLSTVTKELCPCMNPSDSCGECNEDCIVKKIKTELGL